MEWSVASGTGSLASGTGSSSSRSLSSTRTVAIPLDVRQRRHIGPVRPWAWAGGFHSLAPAKTIAKVLPIGPSMRPASTPNMFGALSENIGASGQKSQL